MEVHASVKANEETMNTIMEAYTKKFEMVLSLLGNTTFRERYSCIDGWEPDVYAFIPSPKSKNLKLECFARVSEDQVQKIQSFEFTSHQFFEETIAQCTKTKDKPNQVLMRTRPWDVGYNMIMKVECLDEEEQKHASNILLSREYNILKYLWGCYLKEGWDMEEMLGIPMVFDFQSVPNELYNFVDVHHCKEIDMYGNLIPFRGDTKSTRNSTLCYLTVEKLGPNINYLMQLHGYANSTSPVFTFETAFKIFDQLICRLIQIHRCGVIHYDLCPENVYFGRAQGVNVIYLSNFKAAVCLDATDTNRVKMSKFIGNDRFGSLTALRMITIHPIQDLESAFYLLLAMLSATLPWDIGQLPPSLQYFKTNQHKPVALFRSSVKLDEDVDSAQDINQQNAQRMRNVKASFWKTPSIMRKVIQGIEFEHSEEPYQKQLAAEILYELYGKIKDYMQHDINNKQRHFSYKDLKFTTSKEMAIYSDIRRCALIYFKFDRHLDLLANISYQNKDKIIKGEKDERVAWDLSSWCFSNIDVNTETHSMWPKVLNTIRAVTYMKHNTDTTNIEIPPQLLNNPFFSMPR